MIEVEGVKFYSVLDVAKMIKATPQTVRKYIKQGRIRGQRVGRPFLISEGNLFKFLEGIDGYAPATTPLTK
jgi:excisionase family DNA binding protein